MVDWTKLVFVSVIRVCKHLEDSKVTLYAYIFIP